MPKIVGWQEMECFNRIDLHDTFVLSWSKANDSVQFDLEVSIWQGAPSYEAPKTNEYTCYKRGELRFNGVSDVQGLKYQKEVKPTKDSNGSIDYGNIDHLEKTENGFEVHGEFGHVVITGGVLKFEICA